MDVQPTESSSSWASTGPPTNHGFYLLGDGDFVISHIPMFMLPHAEQIFVEVSFIEQDAVRAALQKESARGTKLFTLKSTEIVLPDIKPADPQRKPLSWFNARLYAGDFLRGGQPLIERLTVIVSRVIVFDKFQAMPAPLDQLTYYCFQSQGHIYLGHVATTPPDFDHILTAKVTGIGTDHLMQGALQIKFAGRTNSADQRLKENESLAGTAGSVKVQVQVGSELVLNTEGMKSQMPALPSPVETGMPVSSLPIEFQWHLGLDTYPNGAWLELFNKNVDLIQLDIKRAQADNKLVVYLSCPISSRGGSYSITNVEIAAFTAQRLIAEWGSQFWVLNPCQYQMESQHGLGLIRKYAHDIELEKFKKDGTKINIDVDRLISDQPPLGGDYLRMWTRVLAEDDPERDGTAQNLGGRFSAFYFLSPSDVRAYFAQDGSQNATVGVESYFARKFSADTIFRAYFSLPLVDEQGTLSQLEPQRQMNELAKRRLEFFRYYTSKASVYYSKGSHDEWNIWQKLNQLRMANPALGIGSQIAGYFEGLQISPSAAETPISRGYAMPEPPTVVPPATHTTPAAQILAKHGMAV